MIKVASSGAAAQHAVLISFIHFILCYDDPISRCSAPVPFFLVHPQTRGCGAASLEGARPRRPHALALALGGSTCCMLALLLYVRASRGRAHWLLCCWPRRQNLGATRHNLYNPYICTCVVQGHAASAALLVGCIRVLIIVSATLGGGCQVRTPVGNNNDAYWAMGAAIGGMWLHAARGGVGHFIWVGLGGMGGNGWEGSHGAGPRGLPVIGWLGEGLVTAHHQHASFGVPGCAAHKKSRNSREAYKAGATAQTTGTQTHTAHTARLG